MGKVDQIRFNIEVHDQIGERYDETHEEIFNEPEQERLRKSLASAVAATGATNAFDIGAGTGNVTKHLLDLGLNVTAGDVSPVFVKILEKKFAGQSHFDAMTLNGINLQGVPDNSFDLTVVYSVLHHVPDYIGLVREMARVTKPGGIVYIDHEQAAAFWEPSSIYLKWRMLGRGGLKVSRKMNPVRFLNRAYWVKRWHKMTNPRWTPDGDIHVWPDDHIEWDRIIGALEHLGFSIHSYEHTLELRNGYSRELWEQYRKQCHDQSCLMMKKT